jgi:hypothetical protein
VIEQIFNEDFEGKSSDIELKINPINSKSTCWYVRIKPIFDSVGRINNLSVSVIEFNRLSKRPFKLESENIFLNELVSKSSHILRSPLSSTFDLLDLIDPYQLDS